MKLKWNIMDSRGNHVHNNIIANDAREALLMYLCHHTSMEDVRIWKNHVNNMWCIAPHGVEDAFLIATPDVHKTTVWATFVSLPAISQLRLVDKNGEIITEDYGNMYEDTYDDLTVLKLDVYDDKENIFTAYVDYCI